MSAVEGEISHVFLIQRQHTTHLLVCFYCSKLQWMQIPDQERCTHGAGTEMASKLFQVCTVQTVLF
jgi:hypothetical protein